MFLEQIPSPGKGRPRTEKCAGKKNVQYRPTPRMARSWRRGKRVAGGNDLRVEAPGASGEPEEPARHPDWRASAAFAAAPREALRPLLTNPQLKVFSTLVMDAATARDLLK